MAEPRLDRKRIAGRWVRWNEQRAVEAYARGLWVRETLADALRRAAESTPERVLIVDGEQRIDAHRMYDEASALGRAMLARAPTGSVVSFMLPNWYESAVIYAAATLAGMVVNPILPSLNERELQFILQDVDTRLIFVPSIFRKQDYVELLNRVIAKIERPPEEVIVLRGEAGPHTRYEALLQASPSVCALPRTDPDAVRMVLYTSGTTGRPKGVMHSHNSLHALLCQLREHWLVSPGDKFLVPSPVGHIGGSIYCFEGPLLLGTTAVLMDIWDPGRAIRLLVDEACTHMAGATPFLEQILAAARQANTRLPSLKLFICGGASVPPLLIRSAAAFFERAVVTRAYGSTEVPVTTLGVTDATDAAHAADTDGLPGIADIRLIDHNSARSGHGEIRARGAQMLVGYLHPEDEADAFDADGFFCTGDLACWVDERYLVVTGRARDIIIRNGENLSPKEVEDLLVNHPNIEQVAIVGLPDARTGERACACIVPRRQPGPDVQALRNFLQELGVAMFKAPEQVVLLETLPKNDAGKILKHRLRAMLQAPNRQSN